jgi:hypothetical protein
MNKIKIAKFYGKVYFLAPNNFSIEMLKIRCQTLPF